MDFTFWMSYIGFYTSTSNLGLNGIVGFTFDALDIFLLLQLPIK
ncbi:hypothetical protein [Winogradskyella sp.]|nr:hypothetical protein [Winogradskyella sp.]